jgi:hypothetical protein
MTRYELDFLKFLKKIMFVAITMRKLRIETKRMSESLYYDKKNAFVLTCDLTDYGLLAGITYQMRHFGKSCKRLGIVAITTNNPQAKGRGERNHLCMEYAY